MSRLVLLVFIISLLSCNTYYNHVIEADYSYDGSFNRYKTFDFVKKDEFEGTDEQKQAIEKYLVQNLEAWGYRQRDRKPNLIVFYNLYFEDMKFQGYRQPDFENWVKWNFNNKIIADKMDTTLTMDDYFSERIYSEDESYDKIRYDLKEGTLLISLYDRRKDKTIWQGYASGVLGSDEFKNERIIRHIVSRVMDKYRVLAVGSI